MKITTRTIVAIGIGAAVFFALKKFGSIPSGIPNTNIDSSYAFLALMAAIFGPIAGAAIGLIGHALFDALTYGSVWWSWVIVSGFVGCVIGFVSLLFHLEEGNFKLKQILIFNAGQIIANLLGWGVLAPALDIWIYAEPVNKVFTQGLVAAATNIVGVAVLGTLFIVIYSRTQTRAGSLKVEE